MNKLNKILLNKNVPEEIKENLGDYISLSDKGDEKYLFKNGSDDDNFIFESVDWNNIKKAPFAYVHENIFKSKVSQLILERAIANTHNINIDELKDDLIEKSYTIKVLNYSNFGHISDIILNFSLEKKIDTSRIRPFILNMLNFISSQEKAGKLAYPIDLDCGYSEDTFFIQLNCRNIGFSFEDILNDKDEQQKYRGEAIDDILKNTELLNLFTLKSTDKIVITGCWFTEGIWDNKKKYPSFILHNVDYLKVNKWETDNSISSFIDISVENILNDNNVFSENIECSNPSEIKNIENKMSDRDYSYSLLKKIDELDVENFKEIIKGNRCDDVGEPLKKSFSNDHDRDSASDVIYSDLRENNYKENIDYNEKINSWKMKKEKLLREMESFIKKNSQVPRSVLNEEMKNILIKKINLKELDTDEIIQYFDDRVNEDWVEKSIVTIKNGENQHSLIEKMSGQLKIRDKQIIKMKEVISRIVKDKNELFFKVKHLKDHNLKANTAVLESSSNVDVGEALKEELERVKFRTSKYLEEIYNIKEKNIEIQKLIEKRESELQNKSRLISEYKKEISRLNSNGDGKKIHALNREINEREQENRKLALRVKGVEHKLKLSNAQISKLKFQHKKVPSEGSRSGELDLQLNTRVKKLEVMHSKMRESNEKLSSELQQKKTELHKSNLENKTLHVKLRELEKKLDFLGRRAS